MIDVNDLSWQRAYSYTTNAMRSFFLDRGFLEIHGQGTLAIMAACEDPRTVSQYVFGGTNWPLPQTNQMNLETILLSNPQLNGVFCTSTSYRDEPNPIPGRHDKIFPMFEFEAKGDVEDLIQTEKDLLDYLGIPGKRSVFEYDEVCDRFGVDSLEAEEEERMHKEIGDVILLRKFPGRSNPFWNMKQTGAEHFNKVDVILYGMETIGSAERSADIVEMRDNFYATSNREYAQLLFNLFTKERVEKELEEYLSLGFFPRFGGGIGVTRMVRALRMAGVL